MLSRRAATLVELLVALVLAGLILGAATSSMLTQQRTHERIGSIARSETQLRAATALLANQLAFLDADAGDFAPGELRDTAIQFRATVAVALACDRSIGTVSFLPDPSGAVPLIGTVSAPRTGDSLWFLADSGWKGARIDAVAVAAASCPMPASSAATAFRITVAGNTDTIPALTPLRVTRRCRYSIYRSGDGTWQLGFREWNDASGSFSAPQPVAGPLVRQANGRTSRFRYFDSGGAELVPNDSDATAVARVRVITHALASARERGQDSVRSDSLDVAVQHARTR